MIQSITKLRDGKPVDLKIGEDFIIGMIKNTSTGERLVMLSIADGDGNEMGIAFNEAECCELAKDILEAAKHLGHSHE